jgi:putative Mg2+ transporter-C (MgtC) family protein
MVAIPGAKPGARILFITPMHELFLAFDNRAGFAAFLSSSIARLALAGLLGAIIGLERELSHKAAGLRTNMFICFGAALFTVLSLRMGVEGERTRIASNIVQGVGFLGAGAILRERGSVIGLTTAATIFVVASIGMAAGAGEYLLAVFSTMVLLLSLQLLGYLETKLSLKPISMTYEVKGARPEDLLDAVNEVLDEAQHPMQAVKVGSAGDQSLVLFTLLATRKEHEAILSRLKGRASLHSVSCFPSALNE